MFIQGTIRIWIGDDEVKSEEMFLKFNTIRKLHSLSINVNKIIIGGLD